MKPDFTLALSSETIQLLHRVESGWHLIGQVKVSEPDMVGNLAALRARALGLGNGAPFGTKLLIPNEQIRYLALDTTRATEDDVRQALQGATPYSVDDLVYDFVTGGGRTYIAAAARQTLAEAEAFAVSHKLAPLSFCASPEPFTYLGEVFFGPTRASRDILPFGTFIDRDPQPVTITGSLDGQEVTETVPPRAVVPPVLSVMAVTAAGPDQHGAKIGAADVAEAASTEQPAAPPTEEAASPETEIAEEEPVEEAPADTDADAETTDAAREPELAETAEAPPRDGLTLMPIEGLDTISGDAGMDHRPDYADGAEVPPKPVTHPPRPVKIDATPEPVAEAAPTEADADADSGTLFAAQPAMASPAEADGPAPGFATRRDPTNPPKVSAPAPVAAAPEAPVSDGSSGFATRRDPTDPPRANGVDAGAAPAVGFASRREPTFPPRSAGAPETALPPEPPLVAPAAVPSPVPVADPPANPDATVLGQALPIPVPPEANSEKTVVGAPLPAAPSLAVPQAEEMLGRDDAPVVTAGSLPGGPAPSLRADTRTSQRESDSRRSGFFSRRRKDRDAAESTAASHPIDPDAAPKVGGKPRFLGLILTVLLLIFMAAVAAMAAFREDAIAWLFGRSAPEETLVAVAPEPTPEPEPEFAPVIGDTAAPTLAGVAAEPPASALPSLPGASRAPVTSGPGDGLLTAPSADTVPNHDPVSAARTQRLTRAPLGQVLTPDEAQRIYAATGVWQRAPRLPVTPRLTSLDGFSPASALTSPARPQMAALPGSGGFETDKVILAQRNPPPPGIDFPRDERGFILATPEGTVMPDGLVIYAGVPPLQPPVRGGLPEDRPPDVLVDQDGLLVLAGSPPVAPPVRAAAARVAVQQTDEGPASETETEASDGLNVVAGSPPVLPPVRTGQPDALAAEVPVDGAETPTTGTLALDATDPAAGSELPDGVIAARDGLLVLAGAPPLLPPARAPLPEVAAVPSAPEVTPEAETTAVDAPVAAPVEDGVIISSDDLIVLAGAPPLAPPVRDAAVISVATAPDGRAALTYSDDLVVLAGAPPLTPPRRPGPGAANAASAAVPGDAAANVASTPTDDDLASRAETVPTDLIETALPLAPDGLALAAFRPNARPVGLQIPVGALLRPDPALSGFRPVLRPAGLAPPAAAPQPDTEPDQAANQAPDPNAALAAAIANAVETAAAEATPRIVDATRQAVPVSARPDARPRNFARVVQQARANQERAAARQQQQQQAAAVPRAAAAQPTAPSTGSVAAAATIEHAINLRQISLIGVYGDASNRRALVRLDNGRYVVVSVGDRLDGGRVTAIGESFVDYTRRSRTSRLEMPAG